MFRSPGSHVPHKSFNLRPVLSVAGGGGEGGAPGWGHFDELPTANSETPKFQGVEGQ